MKNISSLLIAASCTFFVISCNNQTTTDESSHPAKDTAQHNNSTGANTRADDNSMMKCMNRMMDEMKEVKMTGDFDIDFAKMMIEHHRGAVEMSEEKLKSGKDEKIKALAQRIKANNQQEIDQLQSFLKGYKTSNMKHGEGELMNSMNDMQRKMADMEMNGDTDNDFLRMMTMHHEHGIAMAKKEQEHGMSAELKKMAQKTIDESNKDIKEMKDLITGSK